MTQKPPAFTGPAFDRAPTHTRPPLPPLADLAAMLRDGETLPDLAATFERSIRTWAEATGYAWPGARGPVPQDVRAAYAAAHQAAS